MKSGHRSSKCRLCYHQHWHSREWAEAAAAAAAGGWRLSIGRFCGSPVLCTCSAGLPRHRWRRGCRDSCTGRGSNGRAHSRVRWRFSLVRRSLLLLLCCGEPAVSMAVRVMRSSRGQLCSAPVVRRLGRSCRLRGRRRCGRSLLQRCCRDAAPGRFSATARRGPAWGLLDPDLYLHLCLYPSQSCSCLCLCCAASLLTGRAAGTAVAAAAAAVEVAVVWCHGLGGAGSGPLGVTVVLLLHHGLCGALGR